MISEEKQRFLAEGSFARHETFCPRYGWLKKGIDGVETDEGIFERADAIELLGVGKNMVRSIKFWCLAFKLITPKNNEKKLGGPVEATEFAKKLFADDGLDPYLVDCGLVARALRKVRAKRPHAVRFSLRRRTKRPPLVFGIPKQGAVWIRIS